MFLSLVFLLILTNYYLRMAQGRRLPSWLKMQRASGENYSKIKNLSQQFNLNTICSSGNCPNIGECWNIGTATFMILGDICTRACKFCATKTGVPLKPDPKEPSRLAAAVKILNLLHCVITSVDRDDLPDGGASFWAETIKEVKKINPGITIETLIPDFNGNPDNIKLIINAKPTIISHNLETVRRLTPIIRSNAKYDTSLFVLKTVAESGIPAKSGIMLGLGETEKEIIETMDDLRQVGCRIMTIGQYLKPAEGFMEPVEYIEPEKFEKYRKIGIEKGFDFVESSPLVRSSYHAEIHAGLR